MTMYTGMANISIPVFTVQGNELSLPISLTYNYNGLKPAEQISWIGLGWSLQAGGVITHNVRGNDDEYNTSSTHSYENSAALYTQAGVDTAQSYLTAIMSRTYDAEPDVYSFNFAGHSGKFARVKNRYVLFPLQKLKIADNGTGFNITTEDGTIYAFTEAETTQTKSSSGTGFTPAFTSAWYLTSIKNAAQTETITLTYADEGKLSQPGAWSQTLVRALGGGNSEGILSPMELSMPTWVVSKRLTGITSTKYNVVFVPESSGRLDVTPFSTNSIYALSRIDVSANNGGFIKRFHLNHTYFNASASTSAYKYLKLLSVSDIASTSIDGGTTDSLTHYFEYNDAGLPERFGYTGLDHFNYYNGSTGGTNLIPNTIYSSGADRTPNFTASSQGALTKVTYPTKGNTTFEYEANAFNTGSTVLLPLGSSPHITRSDTTTVNEMSITVPVTSDRSQMLRLLWTRSPKAPFPGDDPKDNFHAEVQVYQGNLGGTLIYQGKINQTIQNTSGYLDSVSIGSGSYVVKLICDKSENRVDLTLSYSQLSDISGTALGAGIRVKKITDDPGTGPAIVKKYKYEYGGGAVPNYMTSNHTERVHRPDNPLMYDDHAYFTYNSTLAQSEAPGLPFYYSRVTEDTGSDTVNVNRSVYEFKNFEQGSNNLGVEPSKEFHYKKTAGGYTLLSSKIYEYSTTLIDTIMFGVKPYMIQLEYLSSPALGTKTYSADRYTMESEWKYLIGVTETLYNADTIATRLYNHYNLATRNLTLTQQAASDGTVTTQKMKYPEDYTSGITGNLVSANIIAPVEKQVWFRRSATDSVLINGIVTKYDSLLYKPVKVYALENPAALSSLNNETKDGGGKYNTLLSDSRYKQKVTYYYDAAAKVIGQQVPNGAMNGYQWGYPDPAVSGLNAGKTGYPIAECKNCSSAEFYTQNFEDASSVATGAAHTGNKYYSGTSYTVTWTKPNSRAYVISYWYKSGTWKYSGEIAYTGTSYTLNTGTAYDDICIYPADALLSTYTYKQGIGLSSTIDAKGLTSYYEYDFRNRLSNIKDQFGNILKHSDYNYGAVIYGNVQVSVVVNRANSTCSPGQIGGQYTYTVAGGTYTSSISQADADGQAATDISTYAQAAANANAGCSTAVTINFTNYATGTGGISSLVVKSTSGAVLYTFGASALAAHPVIPQGNYIFEYHTWGDCFDFDNNTGWAAIDVNGGHYLFSACNSSGVYVSDTIELDSVTSCNIVMEDISVYL